MASVIIRGLAKRYTPDGRPALDALSLDVHDGELVALLGPPGSGKTTVLRCLAGLEAPSQGEILIGDRDVTAVPPGERDVAMVFQTNALYPHLSVRGNIAFGLEVRHVAAAEVTGRVDATAARLGLTPMLDHLPAQLSDGDRRRAALGRALARNPRVFLIDEPFSNLESGLRGELRAQLLELHRDLKATIIYATRDHMDAMTLGQRIALLDGGRLRQVGTPAEVYGRPANVFVARLLGSPGMNILAGRARGADEGEGQGGVVDVGVWSVAVPLERYEGEIQLGVRPEHVSLVDPDQGLGPADVRSVEPLGSETLVRLDAGGQALVARVPGLRDFRPGDRVGVKVDRRHLHLFDSAGERIR